MSRWKASAIHLSLSVGVLLASLALLLGLWYPQPYFEAVGGKGLLVLLAGVDVVLGPLVTLIVFKSGKWGMKFDLAVIALLQLSALIYGMSIVVQARPAFVAFSVDRFIVVSALDVNLEGARPEFSRVPWDGPQLVAAPLPEDSKERSDLLFNSIAGGGDVENFARYYRPYAEFGDKAVAKGKSLDVLERKRPEASATLRKFLADRGLSRDDVVYVPLVARKLPMVMILRKNDGQPIDGLAIDPW